MDFPTYLRTFSYLQTLLFSCEFSFTDFPLFLRTFPFFAGFPFFADFLFIHEHFANFFIFLRTFFGNISAHIFCGHFCKNEHLIFKNYQKNFFILFSAFSKMCHHRYYFGK
uniref:Candidate secreted effector n=1 Tax=Meloidogyne incognita TaxID=6306 RepID=A0A914KJI8_MELIC